MALQNRGNDITPVVQTSQGRSAIMNYNYGARTWLGSGIRLAISTPGNVWTEVQTRGSWSPDQY